jgi:hypothetical protein
MSKTLFERHTVWYRILGGDEVIRAGDWCAASKDPEFDMQWGKASAGIGLTPNSATKVGFELLVWVRPVDPLCAAMMRALEQAGKEAA